DRRPLRLAELALVVHDVIAQFHVYVPVELANVPSLGVASTSDHQRRYLSAIGSPESLFRIGLACPSQDHLKKTNSEQGGSEVECPSRRWRTGKCEPPLANFESSTG